MKKIASRTAQFPLFADFTFAFNEWAVDAVDGTKKTFGSLVAGSTDPAEPGLLAGTGIVMDVIPLPVGAVITGGEVIVEQAYVGIGAGATLILGVAGDTACYLAALDLDAALVNARSPLLLTKSLASNNGQNMRMTIAGMAATATAGKVRVRVQYTIDGRQSENQIS
jgi:hypothetical protein